MLQTAMQHESAAGTQMIMTRWRRFNRWQFWLWKWKEVFQQGRNFLPGKKKRRKKSTLKHADILPFSSGFFYVCSSKYVATTEMQVTKWPSIQHKTQGLTAVEDTEVMSCFFFFSWEFAAFRGLREFTFACNLNLHTVGAIQADCSILRLMKTEVLKCWSICIKKVASQSVCSSLLSEFWSILIVSICTFSTYYWRLVNHHKINCQQLW